MKLNDILARLETDEPLPSRVVREADVDDGEFEDLFRSYGFIFEVDLAQEIGYAESYLPCVQLS